MRIYNFSCRRLAHILLNHRLIYQLFLLRFLISLLQFRNTYNYLLANLIKLLCLLWFFLGLLWLWRNTHIFCKLDLIRLFRLLILLICLLWYWRFTNNFIEFNLVTWFLFGDICDLLTFLSFRWLLRLNLFFLSIGLR